MYYHLKFRPVFKWFNLLNTGQYRDSINVNLILPFLASHPRRLNQNKFCRKIFRHRLLQGCQMKLSRRSDQQWLTGC